MATILLTSVAGAPGVSTTALALTMTSPRPALLIEADVTRYSTIMPGYLRGQLRHSKGMEELAVAVHAAGEELTIHQLIGHTLQLDERESDQSMRRVVPGFRDPVAANSWRHLWASLGTTAAALDASGIDVIIDAGRWLPQDPRSPLFTQVDQAMILVRPDLSSLVSARHRMPEFREMTQSMGRDDAIMITPAEMPYAGAVNSGEISKVLGAETSSSLAWDPRSAAILSQGDPERRPFRTTKLGRSVLAIHSRLQDRLQARRQLLNRHPEAVR